MIPKSFTLINRTYDVIAMTPHMGDVADAMGAHNRDTGLVFLSTEHGVSKESLEHTFFHELAHAFFEAAGWPKMSADEDCVDLMGSLLHQYAQTSKGEFKSDT